MIDVAGALDDPTGPGLLIELNTQRCAGLCGRWPKRQTGSPELESPSNLQAVTGAGRFAAGSPSPFRRPLHFAMASNDSQPPSAGGVASENRAESYRQ